MRKVIGIIIVFTLILSGCIKDKKSTDTGRDNYIVCSLGELPASLNLSDLDSSRYAGIDSCVFEGLVTMDRKGNIEPGLAESWSVSSDGIGYKFNIRKDAKWSDGKAISAQDFVSFFESILSGRNAGYFAYDLSPVFGVSDYSKGRKSYDSVAIRSLDKNTLEIRLNKACPDFLKILSKPQYGLRKDKNLLDKWTTAYGSIRYSGPFVIEGVDNKGAVLAKNPFYWNCSEITGEKFLLSESKSKEEALADFETGKTDLLLNPPISEIERIITGDSAVIVNSGNIISLVFNPLNKGITKDMALRKSIVSNIDTKNLKDSYLEEFQPEEYDVFQTVDVFEKTGFTTDEKYMKDNDGKNSNPRVTLTLMAADDDIDKRISRGIAKQLEDNLNVRVDIKYIMEDEMETEAKKGDYDMILSRTSADYDKVMSLYKALKSDNPLNRIGYKNKELDDILSTSLYSDGDKSKEEYARKCSELLVKDCTVIPLFKDVNALLKSDGITGIDVDSRSNIILNRIYKESN